LEFNIVVTLEFNIVVTLEFIIGRKNPKNYKNEVYKEERGKQEQKQNVIIKTKNRL